MRKISVRLLRCIGASATTIACIGLFPLAATASGANDVPSLDASSPSAAASPGVGSEAPDTSGHEDSSPAADASGQASERQATSQADAATDSVETPSLDHDSASADTQREPTSPEATSGHWVRHEAGWRYELEDGTWIHNGVFDVEGHRYAFDARGYVPVGWYKDPSGAWYASTENGVRTGWYHEGGSWYYLGNSGAMATGWFVAGGTWYYAESNGAMATGWVLSNGSWYHLDSSGVLSTGWLRDGGGSWYYLDATRGGAMATGWSQVGGTWNYFDRWKGFWVSDRAGFEADWNYAKSLYSPTNYLVVVDTSAPHCMTFYWADGSWQPLTDMPCSVGKPSTPTITGTFTIKNRGRSFGHGYTAYWWTQFSGDYLFHSVLYYEGTYTVMDGTLGGHVSHGCVRLRYEDAKWLHDTIPSGTYVTIY